MSFKERIEEIRTLDFGSKVCLIGSWIAGTGAAILIGASVSTVVFWSQSKDPNGFTKRALFLGLGTLIGASVFVTGVDMEIDRQNECDYYDSKKKEIN